MPEAGRQFFERQRAKRERRYARYNLLEQLALGNVSAVQALGLPNGVDSDGFPDENPELDSLWQYVPPGADELYTLLLEAGCTYPHPPPNTNDTLTEDYPGEDAETAGLYWWNEAVHNTKVSIRFGSFSLSKLQNLPVQALQILYDLPECSDEQRLQIREMGGGNYRGHPFTSARWSTNSEHDDSASEVDTISDTDDDDVYVPRELREENEPTFRRPMPAVYRDRVDLPPPTYEEVLEWDATH